jgi:aspartyl-tRNA synthetase
MEASHLACTLPSVVFYLKLTPLAGFDRMMAMLCGTKSIRDVIAFPKSSTGTDPLFKSPAIVSNETLSQYGIQSTNPDAGN